MAQLTENKGRRPSLIANKPMFSPNRMKPYGNAYFASRRFASGLRILRPDVLDRDCVFCVPTFCIGTAHCASRCIVSGSYESAPFASPMNRIGTSHFERGQRKMTRAGSGKDCN